MKQLIADAFDNSAKTGQCVVCSLCRYYAEPRIFAYAKTKAQTSFAVTAKLISAFVFATRIVESLFLLNSKFQDSSTYLWLHRPICVALCLKTPGPVVRSVLGE